MAICGAMASPAAAATTVINFDDTAAPKSFEIQTPLTNQYAAYGVTFAALEGGLGTEVLDEASDFGVGARSGDNFLAFNIFTGLGAEVTFATAISGFQIFAGNAAGYHGSYWAKAYNLGGDVVDSLSFQFSPGNQGGYTALNLSGAGITRVQFGSTNANWVADDLSFTVGGAVPEPATWAMMITGFGLAGAALRRRPRSALAA